MNMPLMGGEKGNLLIGSKLNACLRVLDEIGDCFFSRNLRGLLDLRGITLIKVNHHKDTKHTKKCCEIGKKWGRKIGTVRLSDNDAYREIFGVR